jgi:hypothetical protein
MPKRTVRPSQEPAAGARSSPARGGQRDPGPGRPISPPRRHPWLLFASTVALVAWLIFLAWLAWSAAHALL